jgi:hypothetical protein
MAFQEQAVGTAGVGARSVAPVQRSAERARDRSLLATDRQRRPLVILEDLDDACVAAEPTRGVAGQE